MSTVSLQEFVDGIEIAVARYFNGRTWIGPIEINVEHKSLCDGDLGPKTGEMGTLMWYEADGRSPLFDQTLARLAPHLRQADFHGDIDINFIVNDQGAFPIEITARFGSPAVHLQTALHRTPWSVFLQSVADGVECDFDYRQGYGVVVSVVIPPFPYRTIERNRYLKGVEIAFRQPPTPDELRRLHYEEVSRRSDEPDRLRVAGSNGYLLYVTGVGSTIASARESTYALVKKLVIPKMFYRTDIAIRFETVGRPLLERWGWILPVLPEG
jgi:phosphoribosylamine--glycine ligase